MKKQRDSRVNADNDFSLKNLKEVITRMYCRQHTELKFPKSTPVSFLGENIHLINAFDRKVKEFNDQTIKLLP